MERNRPLQWERALPRAPFQFLRNDVFSGSQAGDQEQMGKDCGVPLWCSEKAYRLQSQFAREVKGVDLRSTAGNCAWARTPQLATFFWLRAWMAMRWASAAYMVRIMKYDFRVCVVHVALRAPAKKDENRKTFN